MFIAGLNMKPEIIKQIYATNLADNKNKNHIGVIIDLSAPYAFKASYHGNIVPPGTIVPFAGSTEPFGWLFCHGQDLDGNNDGLADDGSTDGQPTRPELQVLMDLLPADSLPDLRGVFLRGINHGKALDPAGERIVGNYQGQNTGRHRHRIGEGLPFGENVGRAQDRAIGFQYGGGSRYSDYTPGPQTAPDPNDPVFTNNSENRPENVAVNYICKW